MFSVQRKDFGANFVFGAATAAYQIEGGKIKEYRVNMAVTFVVGKVDK